MIPHPNLCRRARDEERRPGRSPAHVPDDAQLAGRSLSVRRGRRCCGHVARAPVSPRGPQPVAPRPVSRAAGPAGPAFAPPDALGWVWGVVSGAPSLPWLCWAGRPLGEVTGVSQLQGPLSAVGVAAFPGPAALGTEPPLCAGS